MPGMPEKLKERELTEETVNTFGKEKQWNNFFGYGYVGVSEVSLFYFPGSSPVSQGFETFTGLVFPPSFPQVFRLLFPGCPDIIENMENGLKE